MGKRWWPFREMEKLRGFTPLEMYWIINSIGQFVKYFDNKDLRQTYFINMTFPIFLKMFREFLKSKGLKDIEKIINDWKHLIEGIFIMLGYGYNLSYRLKNNNPNPSSYPEIYEIQNLLGHWTDEDSLEILSFVYPEVSLDNEINRKQAIIYVQREITNRLLIQELDDKPLFTILSDKTIPIEIRKKYIKRAFGLPVKIQTRLDENLITRNKDQLQIPSRFNEVDCSICLNPLENEEFAELKCGHRLHVNCANMWKDMKPTGECPICKQTGVMFGNKSRKCVRKPTKKYATRNKQ